jgi:type IV pilus assembly protein PilV
VETHRAGGFTLLEVLVAVLVLALAVAGAAASQLTAARARQAAGYTALGVQLAGSLAEAMRANPVQMRLPDARNPYLQLRYESLADGPPATGDACFDDADCDSGEMAAFELAAWKTALHAGFPGARASVCRDAPGNAGQWACSGGAHDPVVIKLGWQAREGGVAPRLAIVVAGAVS